MYRSCLLFGFCWVSIFCWAEEPSVELIDAESDSEAEASVPELPEDSHEVLKTLRKRVTELGLVQEPVPVEGSTSAEGPLFELGKQLFFSKSLSEQKDVACASCHHPLLGGGDALSLPVGVDAVDPGIIGPGRVHDGDRERDPLADGGPNVPRNSPTTFNLHVYQQRLFWDGRVEVTEYHDAEGGEQAHIRTPDSLRNLPDPDVGSDLAAAQAMFPVASANEMFGRRTDKVLSNQDKRQLLERRLQGLDSGEASSTQGDTPWLPLFQAAFDDVRADPSQVVTMERVGQAQAHYQRSQVLLDNPWFRFLEGDDDAISQEARTGALLFYTPLSEGGYGCNQCHSGRRFTDEQFHNIAVPQFGRGKDRQGFDLGRMLESSHPGDRYAFRTPSLLNVEVTGPWGHTGAFLTLGQAIRHHMDVETSVVAYDYSLQSNPQFKGIPTERERYRQRSREVLKEAQSSDSWDHLSHRRFDPEHARYLEVFLETLTDPCAKDPECLARWIPGPNDDGPDGERFRAQLGSFEGQPLTFQPPKSSPSAESQASVVDPWFVDVTESAGLGYELPAAGNGDEQHRVSGGIAVGDYDGDGWDDLFISHSTLPGKLFRNKGDGTFEETTGLAIGSLRSQQFGALFFDYDQDGQRDLLLVEDNIHDDFLRVYQNQGDGFFLPDPFKAGVGFNRFTHSLSAGDYDRDGNIDLYAAHWGFTADADNSGYLWRNEGEGQFVDASSALPPTRESPQTGKLGLVFTAAFTDINNNGWPDLLLAGDFLTSQVLFNQNGENFVDRTEAVISDENGMGMAVGDFDNDGDFDWFVTSIWNSLENKAYVGGESGNRLYRNDGQGRFEDVTEEAGVREGFWGWGACFADFNNDGWLDIFHTNGMSSKNVANEAIFAQFIHDPSLLYINNGDGTFTERALEVGLNHTRQGRGVSCFDYDRDGRVDIFVGHSGEPVALFRNVIETSHHYLTVKLRGGKKNLDGIGAKVYARSGALTQVREIRLGSNYLSNDPLVAHFGLGKHRQVDELTVVWPDGTEQLLRNLEADQYLVVDRPGRR
ncbi:FG-GAP-like repeat-containing protein [Marinimicrobium sp. C2-29]|uniref:FG-GAP-like repeat-containing protein n=1 Tax=Marinimicrobium sp. C2-29 TaxID=3139825 RepID=UPI003139871B